MNGNRNKSAVAREAAVNKKALASSSPDQNKAQENSGENPSSFRAPPEFKSRKVGQCNGRIPGTDKFGSKKFKSLVDVVKTTTHKGKKLVELSPKKIDLACPGYAATSPSDPYRAKCWAGILMSLSRMESGWKASKAYRERNGTLSAGHYALATDVGGIYGKKNCKLGSRDLVSKSHEAFVKQSKCAAAIAIHWVRPEKDGALFSSRKAGLGRRWSVMRGFGGKRGKNKYCQYNIVSSTAKIIGAHKPVAAATAVAQQQKPPGRFMAFRNWVGGFFQGNN